MSVSIENIAEQHVIVHITLEPQEYLPAFEKKCKELRKEINIKGFRKGMVPLGIVKKMHGNQILAEEISKLADAHFTENKIEILLSPISLGEENEFDYTDSGKTYHFDFECAIRPDLDLSALFNPEMEFVRYLTHPNEAIVDEKIKDLQRNLGEVVDLDETEMPQTDDVVNIKLEELDENGDIKEDGVSNTTMIAINMVKEGIERETLQNLKINESAVINLFDAFDQERDKIAKQVLDVSEGAETLPDKYKTTLLKIRRLVLPELDETFFEKVLPGKNIHTLEEFKEEIKNYIDSQFALESNLVFLGQLKEKITELLHVPIPEDFVHKSISISSPEYAEKQLWEDKKETLLKHMKWELILETLIEKYDIRVEDDEIYDATYYETQHHFKRQYNIDVPQEYMHKFVSEKLNKKDYVKGQYLNIASHKALSSLSAQLKVANEEIDPDTFFALNQHTPAKINLLSA